MIGRATLLERLDRELEHIRVLYPGATYVGLAEGAAENGAPLAAHR